MPASNTFLDVSKTISGFIPAYRKGRADKLASEQAAEDRQLGRDKFRQEKEQRDAELAQMGANTEYQRGQTELQQEEINKAKEENKALKRKVVEEKTYRILRQYTKDGLKVRHLNDALKTDEDLQGLWNAERVDNFTPDMSSAEDKRWTDSVLSQLSAIPKGEDQAKVDARSGVKPGARDSSSPGGTKITWDEIDHDKFSKRFLKVVNKVPGPHGKFEVRDAMELIVGTSYYEKQTDVDRAAILADMNLFKIQQQGKEAESAANVAKATEKLQVDKVKADVTSKELGNEMKSEEIVTEQKTRTKTLDELDAKIAQLKSSGSLTDAKTAEIKQLVDEKEALLKAQAIKTKADATNSTATRGSVMAMKWETSKERKANLKTLSAQAGSGTLNQDALETVKTIYKEGGWDKSEYQSFIRKAVDSKLETTGAFDKPHSLWTKEEKDYASNLSNVTDLDEKTKKFITDNQGVVKLSNMASKQMTVEDAGPIDSIFTSLGYKVSEKFSKGQEGRAAYLQAMSGVRHMLYGATLTTNELKNFNEAFGNVYSQYAPLMGSLKAHLRGIRDGYDTQETLPDNSKTQFHRSTYKSRKFLNEAINNIDKSLAKLKALENGKSEGQAQKIADALEPQRDWVYTPSKPTIELKANLETKTTPAPAPTDDVDLDADFK